MKALKITLEIRDPNPDTPSGEEVHEQYIEPQPEPLVSALRQLDGDHISSLLLEQSGHRIFIGGGPRSFNVLAQLGEDEFYDLVGDPSLHGFDSLVIGGQLTPVPLRHLVSFQDAKSVILEFLENNVIGLSQRWERQGDSLHQ